MGELSELQWRTMNVNNYVRFKLTAEGKKLWLDHYKDLAQYGVKARLPKKDGEWYVEQMWTLMQVMGPHVLMGPPVPFETEIQVQVRDA